MGYEDPSNGNPRFPGRPVGNEDFNRLSNVVQGMDLRAEAGAEAGEIHEIDVMAVEYFIQERLGVLSQAVKALGVTLNPNDPLMRAIYLDALTVGKLYQEDKQR